MKTVHLYILSFLFILTPFILIAQEQAENEDALVYKIELFGSAATGSTTPFWIVSNKYGKIPLDSNNGYLSAGVFQNQRFGKGFYWNAGLDVIASTSRYRNVYVQQVYGEIGYKKLQLSIGSKEKYNSLWDRNLSSGDMVFSNNARPLPEINVSLTDFVPIPFTQGWVHLRGDFAAGRSFDTKYLEQFVNDKQIYVKNTLWHHKSLYLRALDSKNGSPFSATLGVQHWAQWGGTSTKYGKQPSSLKDFIRIVTFKEGGSGATASDQANALGNHYGSYDIKFSYKKENWEASFYHQRFFEDGSGAEWATRWDGLWGLEINLPTISWLRKVVLETVETRHQSGTMHFIKFDREYFYSRRGGGNDNYYNNGEYTTGVSYFNRSLASPLLLSPEYNEDGALGFKCNRVKDWHVGAEGDINPQLSYRLLFTVMNNFGTHSRPYRAKKFGVSSVVDITYQHPQLKDWLFKGSLANDAGNVVDNGIGFSVSVIRRGVLKNW
ncbi:MAG: capsule assembly Wzi family protein [Tannerellaceae bacterium]|nr:capsule assembly Wzi family protein [Tannerellaceae bacterium]